MVNGPTDLSKEPAVIRLRMDLFSESLAMCTSAVVLLPQPAAGQIGLEAATGANDAPVPVLYLLHGLSDDCTIWERRTSVERYASEKGIAVVMPEVRRSFYIDEAVGEAYWTYIADELPSIIARAFRVSTAREDTFVAGLSMGGFGAFKLALNRPGQFAAAASLSGALDLTSHDLSHHEGHLARRLFDGRPVEGTCDDLIGLLRAAEPGTLPALHLQCGTEDFLIESNRAFIRAAAERGHELTSDLRPGDHEWGFWDRGIQDVLDWLPIRTAAS